MSEVRIERADLREPRQARAFLEVLDAYASDPMGGGAPLPEDVRERLVPGLLEHPTSHVWLAWEEERAIGVLVGYLGFSTFRAKPLLNIHDLAVVAEYRGRRLGERLLEAAEAHARQLGCCKLTLEVLQHNEPARALYRRFGFGHFAPGIEQKPTAFLEKPLS